MDSSQAEVFKRKLLSLYERYLRYLPKVPGRIFFFLLLGFFSWFKVMHVVSTSCPCPAVPLVLALYVPATRDQAVSRL